MKRSSATILFAATIGLTLLLLTATAAGADFLPTDFTSDTYCSSCHDVLHQQWQTSMHAKSFDDEIYQNTLNLAVSDLGGADNADAKSLQLFCLGCHVPIGKLTGDLPPKNAISASGISCDFCHTVSGTTGIGNGSFVNTPGNVKRGPYFDALSTAHDTTLSTLHTTSEFCGMCHDVYHPTNGLPLEQTYTEWKNGPYAAKNVQCQHCMMGQIKGTQAANTGPVREVVFAHVFAGGNFTLGNKDEALKRLRSAATIKLTTDKAKAKPGDVIKVNVALTNSGAGHKLPTGLTETRDMRLVVTAVDGAGTKTDIFEEKFGTVMEDDKGVHDGSVPVWRAVKIFSDNRLSPLETRKYTQNVKVPDSAQTTYTIEAALKYRSATQTSTDAINMAQLPFTVMAAANKVVTLPGGETAPASTQTPLPWYVWAGVILVILLFVVGSLTLWRRAKRPKK
jgi:hypothetical protein